MGEGCPKGGERFLFLTILRCLLKARTNIQLLLRELAGAEDGDLRLLDVLADVELLGAGSVGALQSEGEDCQVVELHLLRLEEEFADTAHHVAEHAVDGAGREWRVVRRHVLHQTIEVDDGVVSSASAVHAVVVRRLDLVLHQFVLNCHKINSDPYPSASLLPFFTLLLRSELLGFERPQMGKGLKCLVACGTYGDFVIKVNY